MPAGAHSTNSGGARKRCPPMRSTITPALTHINWPRVWLCGWNSVRALNSSQRNCTGFGAGISDSGKWRISGMVSSRDLSCLRRFCLDIAIYDKPDTRRLASMLDVIENNYHEYAFPAVGRADLVD